TIGRGSVFAQTNLPAGSSRTEPPSLAVGDIDPKHSRFYVLVDKTGFGHQHGVEAMLKSGRLQQGGAQSGGEIVIDMTTFNADSDEARRYVGLEGSTDAKTRQEVNK